MAVDDHTHAVTVGRIADAFGVRGQVKVRSFTEHPENLLQFKDWIVSGADRSPQHYRVSHARFDGRFVIATLKGVEDRDQALALKGSHVEVEHEALPQLESGEFYWNDLIGMCVINTAGKRLGTLTTMMETGANDVLVVVGKTECLIPYVPEAVLAIDIESGTIQVDWDEDF